MVRMGTAGWSIPKALAERMPGEGSHLERYARVLTCAEINSSFYKLPRESTWAKWAESVPDGFRFAVKAPKAITHERKLVGCAEELKAFLAAASLLGDRLGPMLLQLPPKLAFNGGVAEEFFAMLRGEFTGAVALEPRHASWFMTEVAEMLKPHEIARAAADPARVPEAAEPGGWAGLRYWRLHGSPRMYYSEYGAEYLEGLARAVHGDGEAWVIFDNTASGAALRDALELRDQLRNEAGLSALGIVPKR